MATLDTNVKDLGDLLTAHHFSGSPSAAKVEIVDKMLRKRARAIGSDEKWARVGVVCEIISLRQPGVKGEPGFLVPNAWLDLCTQWLDEVRADEDWLDSWQGRSEILKAIRKAHTALGRARRYT